MIKTTISVMSLPPWALPNCDDDDDDWACRGRRARDVFKVRKVWYGPEINLTVDFIAATMTVSDVFNFWHSFFNDPDATSTEYRAPSTIYQDNMPGHLVGVKWDCIREAIRKRNGKLAEISAKADAAREEQVENLSMDDKLEIVAQHVVDLKGANETLTARVKNLEVAMSKANTEDVNNGQISDGYHTFDELYEHRHALFIALMASHTDLSWYSSLHDDGTAIKGWFIAGMDIPSGTVTYHLPDSEWAAMENSAAKYMHRAPKWDGHTPDDVVKRLAEWAATSRP